MALLAQLNAALTSLTFSIVLPLREALASRIYRAILHADWAWLTRRRSSTLTHYLTAELNRVGVLAGNLIAVLSNGLVALLVLAVALYLAPLLTLMLCAGFALLIPWQRRNSRAIYASGTEISLRGREVFDSSIERLGNLKVVKAFGAEAAEHALFERRYQAVLAELIGNQWRTIAAARRFQLVSFALLAVLILFALSVLHLAPVRLLIFLFAFVRATPRLNMVQSKAGEILTDLPAYSDIETFLAECARHSAAFTPATGPALTLTRTLNISDLTFAYTAGTPVLRDISLTLRAGEITAISGPSGAGKSTLADLILGLLTPQSGTIAVDEQTVTPTNASAWRTHIGYVSQDTYLFHASIRDNLLWAKPGAALAELEEALAAANATFLSSLSHGIDSNVGDRGLLLSHGQRQRIALARAFLLKPTLLILDEATNSLDIENEATILQTVRESGVTTLLISHRSSALRVAHRVYELEFGRLALTSTHT